MTIERSAFLTPVPIKREEVAMPEFGDGQTLWVYGLSAGEKAEHDSSMMNKEWTGVSRTRAKAQKGRMVIASARDESGGRIFSADDLKVIAEWPSEVVERIVKVADKLNGVASAADLVKNLEPTDDD